MIEKTDPRVTDAIQRWLELRKAEKRPVLRQHLFIPSPELVAGIILAVRDGGQFACVGACVNQEKFRTLALLDAEDSRVPDIAILTAMGRRPLHFIGDPRVLGAIEELPGTVLFVNLGMQAAFIFIADAACRVYQVLWSGPVGQQPELDLTELETPGGTTANDPVPSKSGAAERKPPGSEFPRLVPSPPSPQEDGSMTHFQSPTPRPAAPAVLPRGVPPRPQVSRSTPVTSSPRARQTADDGSSQGNGTASSSADRRPAPSAPPSVTTPGAAPLTARNTPVELAPALLSDEVTVIFVRHLRHAATQLPTAKGAEVAREWLAALERACGDIVGDVAGGSMDLFSALHARGHLETLPSAVSTHAAAKLLVQVTPLVEQISTRRWALRVSALLDRQSPIFRELAKRAPAACRLANSAPSAPTFARRVRKPETSSAAEKPSGRLSKTAELAAQLAAANTEIERLQAENSELRRALSQS